MKAKWVIVGFNSFEEFYRREITYALTVEEMTRILQLLSSRHLSQDEIVDCSLRRGWKGRKVLLDARKSHVGLFTIEVGENPYFTATMVPSSEASDPS